MPASLPDNPLYCFCPFSDGDGEPPQMRILVEGLAFAIPTALVALNAADGLVLAASTAPWVSTATPGRRAPSVACVPASAGRTTPRCTEPARHRGGARLLPG